MIDAPLIIHPNSTQCSDKQYAATDLSLLQRGAVYKMAPCLLIADRSRNDIPEQADAEIKSTQSLSRENERTLYKQDELLGKETSLSIAELQTKLEALIATSGKTD